MIVNSNKHLVFTIPLLLILAVAQPLVSQTSSRPDISLSALVKDLSVQVFWDPLSQIAVLQKNGHLVNFRADDGLVLLDYREAIALDPPVMKNGVLMVTAAFKDRLENFFSAVPPPVSYRVGAILIDPGHGGKDPGAIGTAKINGKNVPIQEKDVVLVVARDLYARLHKAWPDKKILLTRSDDRYISLEDRVDIANSVKLDEHEAILYVSIHANAAFNKKSTGFEVWYLSPDYRRTVIDKSGSESAEILPILNSMMEEEFTTESILIAKSIMDGLDAQIGTQSPNRGLKEESWFVVRNARMPSVLIELGFVSNEKEAALLADTDYLKKCSMGIYNGLFSFISHFEQSRGFTIGQ
ncbi:MAG TPA: N-acetylmuramoyl-L-alanine amidase [Treponema sp.]|nr:N-acetylmuramoyl-L-alanine amidase [Treponema sp.]